MRFFEAGDQTAFTISDSEIAKRTLSEAGDQTAFAISDSEIAKCVSLKRVTKPPSRSMIQKSRNAFL
jgi:hypothetical protein